MKYSRFEKFVFGTLAVSAAAMALSSVVASIVVAIVEAL